VPFGDSYWYNGHLLTKKGEPVVVNQADYDDVIVGQLYRWNGQVLAKGNRAEPGPDVPSFNYGVAIMFLVAAILVVLAGAFIFGWGRRKPVADPVKPPKRAGRIYSDYEQFKLATQVWAGDQQLFENNESKRLTGLEEWVKKGGVASGITLWGFIIVSFSVGTSHGAGAGWGTFFLGCMAFTAVTTAEEKVRRWRNQELFVRREFDQLEPVYQPPAPPPPRNDSPPKQEQRKQEPPPRQERPPKRQEASPPPKTDEIRVTSLRQAFEILELPPGKIARSAAKTAYKDQMLKYHPDRVAHLGVELRELAERKAKFINAAWQYIQENSR
jgi:hypothetical protein